MPVDAAALFAMAHRLLGSGVDRVRGWVVAGLAALLLLAVPLAIDTLPVRVIFLLLVLPAFVAVAWLKVVAPHWKAMTSESAPPAGTVP